MHQTQEDMLDFEGRNKVLYIAWCLPAYSNGWKKKQGLTRGQGDSEKWVFMREQSLYDLTMMGDGEIVAEKNCQDFQHMALP